MGAWYLVAQAAKALCCRRYARDTVHVAFRVDASSQPLHDNHGSVL